MDDGFMKHSEAIGRNRFSRRRLLQAMGTLAVAPGAALAAAKSQKGWMEPRPKLPFKPTGWRTVLLDHLSCKAEDHEKEAAFYNELMNWPVRSNDDGEAVLDIGDWGGIVIRGGYEVSAAEKAASRAQYQRAAAAAHSKGLTMGPYVERHTVFDGFCWGIEPWNASRVEAALEARGLNPVRDNRGKDFESFHVKDPDGFDVQISNGNRHNRRTTPARGKVPELPHFGQTDWKTVWLDHISYECTDYRRTAAFYEALLGWQPLYGYGTIPLHVLSDQILVHIGGFGDAIIRNLFGGGRGSFVDHISFGIEPFHTEAVKSALEKRGLPAAEDSGGLGAMDKSPYKSFHTRTHDGFDLQIANANPRNRGSEPVFKSEYPV